jgi:3-oxoadipate enol-lactonase
MTTAVERCELDVRGGRVEVFLGGVEEPGAPAVCIAHPAGRADASAIELLSEVVPARAVAVNPRGLGGSSPVDRPSFEQMVDDLEAVRQRLGLGPWVFWGMSGGGWLAQTYAERHPAALRGIISESACACFRERLADPTCAISPFFPAWRGLLDARGLISETSHDRPSPGDDTEWMEVEGVGQVFRRRDGPVLLVSPFPVEPEMRTNMPLLWTFDARPWLHELRLPALVLAGTADPVVPVARVKAVADAIPESIYLAVEGAGHVPTVEKRPPAWAAARQFLAELPRGGAA